MLPKHPREEKRSSTASIVGDINEHKTVAEPEEMTLVKVDRQSKNPRAHPIAITSLQKPTPTPFVYTDYASVGPPRVRQQSVVASSLTSSPLRVQKLPSKLNAMLSNPDFAHIVSWMPHGRSWKVHNPHLFSEEVIPRFFEYKNYNSFIRLVNAWGFRRILKGLDQNSYYHELFLRDMPQLHGQMKRLTANEKKAPLDPDDEPDFYRMKPVNSNPRRAVGFAGALAGHSLLMGATDSTVASNSRIAGLTGSNLNNALISLANLQSTNQSSPSRFLGSLQGQLGSSLQGQLGSSTALQDRLLQLSSASPSALSMLSNSSLHLPYNLYSESSRVLDHLREARTTRGRFLGGLESAGDHHLIHRQAQQLLSGQSLRLGTQTQHQHSLLEDLLLRERTRTSTTLSPLDLLRAQHNINAGTGATGVATSSWGTGLGQQGQQLGLSAEDQTSPNQSEARKDEASTK